jgi:F-type H+-transporting ATPase subunit b
MRWFLTVCTLVLAGLLLAGPGSARSAEPGAAPAEQGESEPIIYREGKQEFNLATPDGQKQLIDFLKSNRAEHHLTLEEEPTFLAQMADLTIWTILVFVIVLLILGRYAWKPILELLHKREETIRTGLEEAEKARAETARLRDQLQQEMAQSQDKVRQVLDEGRRAAQRQQDEMMAQARAEIQGERDRLHREIEMARDQALQQLWAQTADLATLVASKAIRRQLTPDDNRRLVDEALVELRQTERNGHGTRAVT